MKKVIIFNDHILPKTGGATIRTVAYTDYQALEKEVKELKEHLQVKKLADSPIIAMIDNKPVHQNEYEALKKQVKDLKQVIQEAIIDVNQKIKELEND